MRIPRVYDERDQLLMPFVVAANTDSLAAACDFLFIHGNDLMWGPPGLGLFLVGAKLDDGFEEALQVMESVASLTAKRMLRNFIPMMKPFLAAVMPAGDSEPSAGDVVRGLRDTFGEKWWKGTGVAEHAEHLADSLPGLVSWMAHYVADTAIEFRARLIAASGHSESSFDEMLYALERMSGMCESILAVALPKGGFSPALVLSVESGSKALVARKGSSIVQIFRVASELAKCKRGQDKALPLFISSYINAGLMGESRSFPCAYYGDASGPELDVVIPAIDVGFEVKLVQAPYTQTENKIENFVRQLRDQLPGYFEEGCKTVYVVTNLRQEFADAGVKRACQAPGLVGKNVIAVGGEVEHLMSILSTVAKQLDDKNAEVLNAELKRIAPPNTAESKQDD